MNYLNNHIAFAAADETFIGDCVKQTKSEISIDLGVGKGVATLPLEEGTIHIISNKKRFAVKRGKATTKRVVKKAKAVEVKPTRSKKELALDIYRQRISSGRAAVIDLFQTELGMSKAGATTYFYNCKKAEG